MNLKHLRKFPVVQPNIFKRYFESTCPQNRPKIALQKERWKFGNSNTMPNLSTLGDAPILTSKTAIFSILKRINSVTNRPNPSKINLKQTHSSVTFKTALKYRKFTQTRNYSSLIDKIRKFINSLSATKQPQEAKIELKQHNQQINKLESIKFQTAVQETKQESEEETQKMEMKEFSEKFEVENTGKPPFRPEGKFMEDRLAKEMPRKYNQKLKNESKTKPLAKTDRKRIKTITAETVMREQLGRGKKPADDTYASCDMDDTYAGIEPPNDNKIISTAQCQNGPRKLKKTMTACNTEYVTEAARPKNPDECGEEKKITKSCKPKATAEKPKCKRQSSPGTSKKSLLAQTDAKKGQKRDFKKISGDFVANYSSSYELSRLVKESSMKRDPIVFNVEKKDPEPDVEYKDPEAPDPLDEPGTNREIGERMRYWEIFAADEAKCGNKRKREKKKCEKDVTKREETECPELKSECTKKDTLCEETTKLNVEECLATKQDRCCHKKDKIPKVECNICKKFEILDIPPKPKPKPLNCKLLPKCGKKPKPCLDAQLPPSNCCKPLAKRPTPCPRCPKPKFPEAKPELIKSGPCLQKKCVSKRPPCRPDCAKAAPPKQSEPEPTCAKASKTKSRPPAKKLSAKQMEKEAARKEKMCVKKKRKSARCSENTCKTKDACVKKKEKRATEKAQRGMPPPKKNTCDVGVHSDWRPIPIVGAKKYKPKSKSKSTTQSCTLRPDTSPKYQSPRFEKKKNKCKKGKKATSESVDSLLCPGRDYDVESRYVDAAKSLPTMPYRVTGLGSDNFDDSKKKKKYSFFMDEDFPEFGNKKED